MALDPRTPVLIGVGQFASSARDDFDDALDPSPLMCRRSATRPPMPGWRSMPDAAVGPGRQPAQLAVRRPGLRGRRAARPDADARRRTRRWAATARRAWSTRRPREIQAGELDIAILAGGEAWRTRMRARKAGVELRLADAPPRTSDPRIIGEDLVMNHPAELARGIDDAGADLPDVRDRDPRRVPAAPPSEHLRAHQRAVVAVQRGRRRQPVRLVRDERRRPRRSARRRPTNRMVGLPYTEVHELEQRRRHGRGAHHVLGRARPQALGVPADRWVFVHSGADCHEHQFVSNRWSFAETPAIELGGRRGARAGRAAPSTTSTLVDLYSCFPSAVQLGAQSLGLTLDRQLTRTGGLSFAGGPWNNYVMHAIATMVDDLRDRARRRSAWCGRTAATPPSTRSACTRTDATRARLPPRRPAGRDRRAAAPRAGRCRRRRRAGDHRGVHGDALARRRARDRDRRVPAGRRPAGVGHVDRPGLADGDVRRRVGRATGSSRPTLGVVAAD